MTNKKAKNSASYIKKIQEFVIFFLLLTSLSFSAFSQNDGFLVTVKVGKKIFDCKYSHPIEINSTKWGETFFINPNLYDTCSITILKDIECVFNDTISFVYAPEIMGYYKPIKMPSSELCTISSIYVWIFKLDNKQYRIEYDVYLEGSKKYTSISHSQKLKYASKHTKWLLKQGYSKKRKK